MKQIKNFIKQHDIWLRLLSLVLAVFLWATVMDLENPQRSMPYEGIKLDIQGEDNLLERSGLSVIEVDTQEISVRVYGRNAEITDTTLRKRITASIDVSDLKTAGEHDLVPAVTVSKSGIDVTRIEPGTVRVRVDKLTTATVPVQVEAVGTPAEGFRVGKAEPVTTTEVTIEGPAGELSQVAYAYATISVEGITSSKTEDCSITLFTESGEMVTGPHIKCQTQTVSVRVPVYKFDVIPLAVTLRDGSTVKAEQASVTIDPESVGVSSANQKLLGELKEINLGEIDLDTVRTDVPVELPIKLPEGVTLDEGQPTTAKVTVSLNGVDTRQIEVTRFAPNDTTEAPLYHVEVETKSVTVELRGEAAELETLTGDDFTIGLTYDSTALGPGRHQVKGLVVASNLPDGVMLVEEDVQVMIRVVAEDAGMQAQQTGMINTLLPKKGGDGA